MRNSLRALEGVNEVEVDLEEEIATVIYETAKLNPVRMIEATTDVGFPSSVRKDAN